LGAVLTAFTLGGSASAQTTPYFTQTPDFSQTTPDFTNQATIPSTLAQAAAEFIQQGDAAYLANNYDLAIDHYTNALTADPGSLAAVWKREKVYFFLKKYDKALADCTEAIRLKPEQHIYLQRALCCASLNQLDRAIEDLNQAIKLKPDFVEAYRLRASLFARQSNFERAFEDNDAAMKLTPGIPGDYNLRCELNRILERNDLAVEAANEAIKLDPIYAQAYFNRGFAYYQLGNYARAREDENAALKLNPKFSAAVNALSLIDERTGSYERSVEEAIAACRLDPEDVAFLTNEATMFIRTGDLARAEQAMQEATKLQPDNCTLFFPRALLQIKHQDIAGAFDTLEKFPAWIDHFDPIGKSRSHEAQLLLELHRAEDALDALSKMKVTGEGTMLADKLALMSCGDRMLGNSRVADSELAQAKSMVPQSVFVNNLANGTATSLLGSVRKPEAATTAP
jgi:tetratricopeptide (TPR) repeat protein